MVTESMLRHWHDRLYRIANEIVRKENPCQVRDGSCVRGRSMSHTPNGYATGKDGRSFCCGGHVAVAKQSLPIHQACPGLVKGKCRLCSINCRTWLCDYAIDANFNTYQKLLKVYHIAQKAGFIGLRRSSRVEEIGLAVSRRIG